MTTHQKAQGYHPSLNSMFCAKPPPSLTGSSLLYDPGMQKDSRHQGSLHQHHHHHSSSSSRPQQADVSRSSSIQWESRADAAHGSSSSRYEEHNREPTRLESGRILKTVYVPRACLHRFNAIAKANTLVNKETCGLLLGKDNRELVKTPARRRDAYVVTTLLIPKQRATSDTCAMEEEESVLRFTEERGLITLGWIHTHPTQTCVLFLAFGFVGIDAFRRFHVLCGSAHALWVPVYAAGELRGCLCAAAETQVRLFFFFFLLFFSCVLTDLGCKLWDLSVDGSAGAADGVAVHGQGCVPSAPGRADIYGCGSGACCDEG